jgi:methylated-DNA-protein-cysteine methyltransferase-like protein
MLTGKAHFGDEKAMQRLLQAEGVRVEHDRVVDFEQLYWDPLREIQY